MYRVTCTCVYSFTESERLCLLWTPFLHVLLALWNSSWGLALPDVFLVSFLLDFLRTDPELWNLVLLSVRPSPLPLCSFLAPDCLSPCCWGCSGWIRLCSVNRVSSEGRIPASYSPWWQGTEACSRVRLGLVRCLRWPWRWGGRRAHVTTHPWFCFMSCDLLGSVQRPEVWQLYFCMVLLW